MEAVPLVLAAYFWGAVPSAYLAGRYFRGVDIRRHGSGNVGAANITELMGWKAGLSLGTFDCLGKGALPVAVAALLGQSVAVQAGVGLATIVGHNWSPFIRFTGGRGVATAIGVYVASLMLYELLAQAVLFGLVGRLLLRDSGLWTLVSMLAIPPMAFALGRDQELVIMSGAIAAVLIAKRLTANWAMPQGDYRLSRLLAYRLLWDRDVPRKQQWIAGDRRADGGG